MRFPYFGRVKKMCQTIDGLDVEMWNMLVTMCFMLILFKSHDSNFWLTIKTKAWKGKWALETHHGLKHILTSVRKCKGMSPNSFKCIPTLGIGVLWVSQLFVTKVHIENLVSIDLYLNHWKGLQMKILKMNLHFPFGDWKFQLWIKLCSDLSLGLWSMLGHKRGWRLGECVKIQAFECGQNAKEASLKHSEMGITCGVPNCFDFLGLKCRWQIVFKLNKLDIVKFFKKCRYQRCLWGGWGGWGGRGNDNHTTSRGEGKSFNWKLHQNSPQPPWNHIHNPPLVSSHLLSRILPHPLFHLKLLS